MLLVPTEMYKVPNSSNRLTHTEQVMAIAAAIAHKLDLDADLTKLIAAVHDIGHLPYGHYAEKLICRRLFPGRGLRAKHEENGAQVYSRIVTRQNVDPDCYVVGGIREHREIAGSHSTPESDAVAHADDLASTISNIQDGLTLPAEEGCEVRLEEINAKLSGRLLKETPLDHWGELFVSELYRKRPTGAIARSRKLEEAVGNLRLAAKRLVGHSWIRAKPLDIEGRLRRFFDQKCSKGMGPQQVIDEFLLTMTERDLAEFA